MKRVMLLSVVLLFTYSIAVAQPTKFAFVKIKFSSIIQVGLLSGAKGESTLVQTVNGIRKDKWFTGIGVGLDFYNERGIPIFLEVRRDLFDTKNTPFVYADGGVNFAWLNFVQKEQRNFPSVSGGAYYDIGVGWKLIGKKEKGLIFSAGYSLKQVKERSDLYVYNPIIFTGENSFQYMDYRYRRLVVKVGVQL